VAELLLWPLIAGLVLTAIHAWFGLHVLARGVVFVDLSLAQMAALGLTVAILAGHAVQSEAGYWYALAFALAGAVLFAVVRACERAIQQEAVIGIVYAVSASLGVIALDRAPQGAEHIKQLLIGSILTVTPEETGMLALLYAVIGVVHFACRRPLVDVSFEPHRALGARRVFLWDIVFYGSFALVVTSSVRIAGVLLVFSYLIVPAALAGVLARRLGMRLLVAWALGALLTAAGLYASWEWDLPTGPAIVSAFGAAAAVVGLAFALRKSSLRGFAKLVLVAITAVGLLLLTFPKMDQPWLDALESLAPGLQTAFLDEHENATRRDMLESIDRSHAELARLRELDQDVRWGRKELDAEQVERLRQYIAGRSEISAGEQLVLRNLRGKARERQRLMLGLPLVVCGALGLYVLQQKRLSRKANESRT
jgi:zinc/manganese transport system permease protein